MSRVVKQGMERAAQFSERQAWERVEELASELRAFGHSPAIESRAAEIQATAAEMLGQLGAGVHVNPPLVIFGNPKRGKPVDGAGTKARGTRTVELEGQMSKDVHEVFYTHLENGDDFHHPFAGDVNLFAGFDERRAHVLLVTHQHGKPLWEHVR